MRKINKKGDVQSIIFTIVTMFVIGIVLFFFSHLFSAFYGEFQGIISTDTNLNSTGEAATVLSQIQEVEHSAWDYAFLGIFISYVLLIFILSYSTQITPVFYWIAVVLCLFGLFVGVMLSNTWMKMVEMPEFADTYIRFPITNLILGSYYPMIITFVSVLGLVLLFAKPSQGGG